MSTRATLKTYCLRVTLSWCWTKCQVCCSLNSPVRCASYVNTSARNKMLKEKLLVLVVMIIATAIPEITASAQYHRYGISRGRMSPDMTPAPRARTAPDRGASRMDRGRARRPRPHARRAPHARPTPHARRAPHARPAPHAGRRPDHRGRRRHYQPPQPPVVYGRPTRPAVVYNRPPPPPRGPSYAELISLCNGVFSFQSERQKCIKLAGTMGPNADLVIQECSQQSFSSGRFQCMREAQSWGSKRRYVRIARICHAKFSFESERKKCRKLAQGLNAAKLVVNQCATESFSSEKFRCLKQAALWTNGSLFVDVRRACTNGFSFQSERRRCLDEARFIHRRQVVGVINACTQAGSFSSNKFSCIQNAPRRRR